MTLATCFKKPKPPREKKPYTLKRGRIRKVGRKGLVRAMAMQAARAAYVRNFGVAGEKLYGPCQMCRKFDEFELHHKLRRSQGGDEQGGNLIALCPGPAGCHAWAHRNRENYEAVKACEANVGNGLQFDIPGGNPLAGSWSPKPISEVRRLVPPPIH